MGRIANIVMSHTAAYKTIYDGKGGIKWEDNGGLYCRGCEMEFPLTPGEYIRPWDRFNQHVEDEILRPIFEIGIWKKFQRENTPITEVRKELLSALQKEA